MIRGGSELLMAGGAFDGTMNGHGSIGGGGGRTGSVTPTPGSGSSAFDICDFPILGRGQGGGVGGSIGGAGDGLAVMLRQQHQALIAHQQMVQPGSKPSSGLYRLATQAGQGQSQSSGNGVINIATEDFPALPGVSAPSISGGGIGGFGSIHHDSSDASAPPSPSPFAEVTPVISRTSSAGSGGLGLFGAEVDGMLGQKSQLEGRPLGSIGGAPAGAIGSRSSSAPAPPSGNNPGASPGSNGVSGSIGSSGGTTSLSSDFGLLGLLSVIRMTDADRNALALGSDLTALGMNLNSSEKLYSTFASPWSENPTTREPQYQLPMCYYMQPPALKTGHLSKFQLETLFYIFYALPKDVLQAYAAQELYSREWRYHVNLKLWFKRAGPSDGLAATVNGGSQYIYFDVNTWERRLFNGNLQNITGGLLSEDDVRVKFPTS